MTLRRLIKSNTIRTRRSALLKKLKALLTVFSVILVILTFLSATVYYDEETDIELNVAPAPDDDRSKKHKQLMPVYPIVRNPLGPDDLSPLPGNRTPIIMMWNNIVMVGLQFDNVPSSYYSDTDLKCPTLLPSFKSGRCFFTKDRNYLDKADIVFVSVHEWRYKAEPIPQNRSRSQYWTFFESESPVHLYHSDYRWARVSPRKLHNITSQFNWTMTYRLDSTIPATYGRFEPLEVPDLTRNYDRLVNKSADAIYMASCYCNDRHSHRDQYAQKMLAAGIDIETIGECKMPNNKTSPLANDPSCRRTAVWSTNDECTEKIGARYKFYLSFENSLCIDYLTEKFYRAASTDTIPVVLNGVNMSLVAPPHSYIDAKDFESPQRLAAYLKQVSSDSKLYNSYFWWKPYYNVVNMMEGFYYKRSLCQLCAYAHKKLTHPTPSQIDDVEDWWINKAKCTEGSST